jgi:hypothetical protein
MRQRAHRFDNALRRQTWHAAEDIGRRFRNFLHLVDRPAREALLLRQGGLIDGRDIAGGGASGW